MFNFQGSELIIILLLALVVLGPEKLPDAMRRLGQFVADLKKMSSGFQEEFRAAVDEPTRELRETANTLRDSVDFRKLSEGERAEKPKSAEMASADAGVADLAPAEPGAHPSDDVPFQDTDHDAPPGDQDAGTPADVSSHSRADFLADDVDDVDERHAAFVNQTSTPPPPPAPFSSSQSISAAPRARRDEASDESSTSGEQPDAATVRRIAPQVAVDDEHGLREARPADQDGAA